MNNSLIFRLVFAMILFLISTKLIFAKSDKQNCKVILVSFDLILPKIVHAIESKNCQDIKVILNENKNFPGKIIEDNDECLDIKDTLKKRTGYIDITFYEEAKKICPNSFSARKFNKIS